VPVLKGLRDYVCPFSELLALGLSLRIFAEESEVDENKSTDGSPGEAHPLSPEHIFPAHPSSKQIVIALLWDTLSLWQRSLVCMSSCLNWEFPKRLRAFSVQVNGQRIQRMASVIDRHLWKGVL
jgi:hypothetical protein